MKNCLSTFKINKKECINSTYVESIFSEGFNEKLTDIEIFTYKEQPSDEKLSENMQWLNVVNKKAEFSLAIPNKLCWEELRGLVKVLELLNLQIKSSESFVGENNYKQIRSLILKKGIEKYKLLYSVKEGKEEKIFCSGKKCLKLLFEIAFTTSFTPIAAIGIRNLNRYLRELFYLGGCMTISKLKEQSVELLPITIAIGEIQIEVTDLVTLLNGAEFQIEVPSNCKGALLFNDSLLSEADIQFEEGSKKMKILVSDKILKDSNGNLTDLKQLLTTINDTYKE